jgi:hypothetical protein
MHYKKQVKHPIISPGGFEPLSLLKIESPSFLTGRSEFCTPRGRFRLASEVRWVASGFDFQRLYYVVRRSDNSAYPKPVLLLNKKQMALAEISAFEYGHWKYTSQTILLFRGAF